MLASRSIVPAFQARPARILLFALAALVSRGGAPGAAAQDLRFKSSIDLTSIDVAVVNGRGDPIRDLVATDFAVRIDGKPRQVTTAEWVSLGSALRRGETAPAD